MRERERLDNKVNLCDSCSKNVYDCESTNGQVLFGDGLSNDNVAACWAYVPLKTRQWAKDRKQEQTK